MTTNQKIISIPWTTLLWHQRNFILVYFLSWITKPCTMVIYKYRLTVTLCRSRKIYLVLQLGKVASKSIQSFLKDARVLKPFLHLHYISQNGVTLEHHGPTDLDLYFPSVPIIIKHLPTLQTLWAKQGSQPWQKSPRIVT